MKAIYWDMETQGMKFEFREIPAALEAQAEEYRAKMIEAAAEGDDALTDKYLDGAAAHRRRDQARPQGARAQERDRAVHVRHGVQEQGRAGAARRRHRVHAVADRDAAHQGTVRARRDHHAHGERRSAVLGAGFQDPQRSVRRQSHLLPRLLRHAEFRRHGVRADQGRRRNASGACCRCTPTSAARSRKCAPATSPRPWASRTSTPATRCAISRRSSRSRR